jgi:hypothetical protein
MSERKQRIVLWWSLIFMLLYAIAIRFGFHMMPPPSAHQTSNEVARWYQDHRTSIRIGAAIAGWTSAFMIPYGVVIYFQIARQEQGAKVWSVLALCSGALTAVFFAVPPLAWGAAAFSPARAPQITALMHEFGTLTFITTDQMYVFMWVVVAIVCLTPTTVKHSPFPRWFGYLTAWIVIMFEAGAIAFIPHSGPFAWNGLLAFWSPLILYGAWMLLMAWLILRALRRQQEEAEPVTATASRPRHSVSPTPSLAPLPE